MIMSVVNQYCLVRGSFNASFALVQVVSNTSPRCVSWLANYHIILVILIYQHGMLRAFEEMERSCKEGGRKMI